MPIFVLGLALLGSQAGHLLAYEVRFGAAAPQIQSSGAHAYLPLVAKTGLGVAAVLILGGLFVIGLARIAGRRRVTPLPAAASYLSLLAALFTIQLIGFSIQETAEAAVAGAPAASVAVLLLWGTLGQLPVAAISALVLRWLVAELESAVQEIRIALELVELGPQVVPAAVMVPNLSGETGLLSSVAGRALSKRGPPSVWPSATY